MLELSCKAFAPPAPQLSLVQEAVRDTMRHRFPGAQFGVKSWPSLLQRHEQAAEAAEQWEPPAEFTEDQDDAVGAFKTLCDELKDEGFLREQRAAMSRLIVATLARAVTKGIANQVNTVSNWLAWLSELPQYVGSVVAAGAPHTLVEMLQTGSDDAKENAVYILANIAEQEQHVGAMVAAGAIEACVAVLRSGPDTAKTNVAVALVNVAEQKQHVDAVVAAGAIEACVAVLQTGPGEAKQNAAGTLANIARQEQHVDALVAAGAKEVCVAVLQTGPYEVKQNAAATLENMRVQCSMRVQ